MHGSLMRYPGGEKMGWGRRSGFAQRSVFTVTADHRFCETLSYTRDQLSSNDSPELFSQPYTIVFLSRSCRLLRA